ncbi:RNA polymerase sigma factor RpoH [Pseudomonas aeruginosa]|uniref:RNA polymerase sigma factor RpoH n=1 Tax=Pseudomonas aeruginosa TaxID=287 RepID=UPI001A1CE43E|nr:RNA polymerase sigma factor RpoH [Pseudomonas aeruginosa]EKV0397261.1 RNA polymerase sigma factor RpoH [Pseudomonas aeruginosa]EKV3012180.1 RNA polymerase sigma factor RpoH [Pseudomonas aeruginosa]MBH4318849.1 RNA polymerase sigma factor RpoH [Pseudomonas aeruginosa]MBH8701060.1 RNA polymerase sigma factor RpoH [Pseudomonas aeruginosa]WBM11023.1 RNA polymerase sigma factor RpoH [Pseudomonas aeruginosa]
MFTPGGNIEAYLAAINTLTFFTAEEEIKLAQRLHEHHDLEAARQLVMSQLRLVASLAKRYMGYGLPLADLIQEGNVGLMKAVKRFNPNVGVRLMSFAVHWIKAEIHEFILRNWRTVRVATTKAQRKLFFNLRRQKRQQGWLSQDEAQVVASNLGVSVREVLEMEGRLAGNDTAFDPATESEDEEAARAPANYLEDHRYDPAQQYEAAVTDDQRSNELYSALEKLDERSRDIVTKRWLNNSKVTLQDLAAEHGVSAERIRQLEKSALLALRAAMPNAA